jgi:hypothetical protein
MIIQRLFGKVLRDKHTLELAEKRLKGMRQKQRNFLRINLEKTVITEHPEKVVNDVESFKKRLGRTERNKLSDSDFAKRIEETM